MIRFFKSRRPGPADLTWEEKNSADYLYYPKDTSKLQNFIRRERKSKEGPQKTEQSSKDKK